MVNMLNIGKKKILDNSQLDTLNESLSKLFPENKIQKKPLFLENYYWDQGACYWKKNINSEKVYNKMIKPTSLNLYFVGDSFSLQQAWMEGALDTSNKVFDILKTN